MEFLKSVEEWLNQPLFGVGSWGLTAMSVLKLTVLPVVLFVLAKAFQTVVLKRLQHNPRLGPGVPNSIATLVYYAILVVGLFAIVSSSGLDFRALAAFTGALGLGVGLGLQEIARNFISGLIMLATRPVKIGDRIELEGLAGDVRKIGFYSTVVVTLEDAAVIVPNSFLLQNMLVNWTHTGRRRRISIPLGVHYDSDPEHVRGVVEQVALECEDVLKDPPPDVRLMRFGDSSVEFELVVWTETFVFLPNLLISRLNFGIHKGLKQAGIVIPYPQRDLHIKSSELPVSPIEVK